MKKIFTLAALVLMLSTSAGAQTLRKTWDFREGFSQKTVNALKGDQEEFGADKYWRNYESDATKADQQHYWCASKSAKNGDGYASTHNGGQERVIDELDGLKLGFSAAKKFVITYNGATYPNEFESEGGPALGEPIPHGKSYIWLNGKNETIQFQAEVNQKIRIGVESHAVNRTKLGEARGISLSAEGGSLTPKFTGNPVPTYYTEYEWDLEGDEGNVANLTIKTTNGCHIYFIIVGEGDDPNANKTKVAYVTAGDATAEPVYQQLVAEESYVVTPLDAATLTAEQLSAYHATVISPLLPADNAAVSVLKAAMPFNPIVNLNASLYTAWGYGEVSQSMMPLAIVADQKNALFYGFTMPSETDPDGDFIDAGDMVGIQLSESVFPLVRLGEYFAGDAAPIIDSGDSTLVAAHIHNQYHNAYIFVPYTADATVQVQKMIINAIDIAKSSKSEVTQAPAPKIKLDYKDLNTNITLSMASSSLPKPQIFYTLDGTDPTEASTPYTKMLNVTEPTTVKAVAIAEGYLLSPVAEANAEIFAQPAKPVIACDYQDGKTIVTLTAADDVDIWYNYTNEVETDSTKSMKYTEPITLTLPSHLSAFAVAGHQVFSELSQQRIVIKNVSVRQDEIGRFDANAADFQNGGGSTVYYFTWGKNAASIMDTSAEPIDVVVDTITGDETPVYPEKVSQTYIPANEENYWQVSSKGQVMIWQSLTTGSDPGNAEGYNPETSGDILSYAKITNNDIQFGSKADGERYTGAIISTKKFQGPFDVVTILGTSAGGDNVGRMLVQVSAGDIPSRFTPGDSAYVQYAADSLQWTTLGTTMNTSTVKRLWKSYTRNYDGADEVYVRIIQDGGGSGAQVYNMYLLNAGEKSLVLKQQYDAEYEAQMSGISTVGVSAVKPVGVYSINGVRQEGMRRGLNIVVGSDGTVRKVLMK